MRAVAPAASSTPHSPQLSSTALQLRSARHAAIVLAGTQRLLLLQLQQCSWSISRHNIRCCCRTRASSRLKQLAPHEPEPPTSAPPLAAAADDDDAKGEPQAPASSSSGGDEGDDTVAAVTPLTAQQAAVALEDGAAHATTPWTASSDEAVEQAVRVLQSAARGGKAYAVQLHPEAPAVMPLLGYARAALVGAGDAAVHLLPAGGGSDVTAAGGQGCAPDDAAAAAGADDEPGTFFGSRGAMLQQLQLAQLQVRRQHLLQQQQRWLYRYDLDDRGSRIVRRKRAGTQSALKQAVFPLARPQQQQQQQQQPSSSDALPAGVPGSGLMPLAALQQQELAQQQAAQAAALAEVALPGYMQPLTQPGGGGSSSAPPDQQQQQQQLSGQPAAASDDLSRGVTLAVFLYHCSRNELLSLAWQLGLSPAALRVVPRLQDADAVLHVKPRPGEKHHQYAELRAQAADRGIPFVDLKALTPLELQLYLLPVFRLYSGELAPRDLLLRSKRRGRRARYTSIKLPPV